VAPDLAASGAHRWPAKLADVVVTASYIWRNGNRHAERSQYKDMERVGEENYKINLLLLVIENPGLARLDLVVMAAAATAIGSNWCKQESAPI
jgi:hypothetical protein